MLIVQGWIGGKRIRNQRMAVAHTLLHCLDDFPLAQQHVAQRHFARTVCVPDVTASLGKVLEFRNRKALAPRSA